MNEPAWHMCCTWTCKGTLCYPSFARRHLWISSHKFNVFHEAHWAYLRLVIGSCVIAIVHQCFELSCYAPARWHVELLFLMVNWWIKYLEGYAIFEWSLLYIPYASDCVWDHTCYMHTWDLLFKATVHGVHSRPFITLCLRSSLRIGLVASDIHVFITVLQDGTPPRVHKRQWQLWRWSMIRRMQTST